MRQRLNKRISENLHNKQPVTKDTRETRDQGQAGLDPKLLTWLEVQSRSRQMTVEQLHQQVEVKREEVTTSHNNNKK